MRPHGVVMRTPGLERLLAARQGLQREHLAVLMRAHGDAVGDRGTQQLGHRAGLKLIAGQIAVLRVPFQQPLAFQRRLDALR